MTKEEIKEALAKKPSELSKEQLSEIFGIFCLNIKEYHVNERELRFEIHFRRTYLVRVSYPIGWGSMSFSNEFVNFTEGCHGIAVGKAKDTMELLIIFTNMFYKNLLIDAEYSPYYDEETSRYSSAEEATDYLEYVKSLL